MNSSSRHSDNYGRTAFRNAALVVTLLLLMTPLRPLAILIVSFSALVLLLRFAYTANRTLGIALIALVGLGASYYLTLQFLADQSYQRLLAELKTFDDVTVRREFFPFPRVPQLSIGNGVTDGQLQAIFDLDGLADISELYLKNNELTDNSLAIVASSLDLNYIFIDCEKITDAAILEFENRFPDCRVIPYKRELHDDGVEVFLGPPPIGE
jgi:hypothetical protein